MEKVNVVNTGEVKAAERVDGHKLNCSAVGESQQGGDFFLLPDSDSRCTCDKRLAARDNSVNESPELSTASTESGKTEQGLLPCPFCGEEAQELGMQGKSLVRHYPHTDWMTPEQWNSRADIASQVLGCGKCSVNRADAIAYLESIGADTDEERILLAEFLATAPTVRQIWLATSIALAQRERNKPDSEDVEAAIKELREMFSGNPFLFVRQEAMSHPSLGDETRVDIQVEGAGFRGKTVAEAMQKVREWKEANQTDKDLELNK